MDEFGELALAFNTMTAKLVSSIDALEKEKNFVRHIIESLTHPFYVIDVRDYTIKLANSAAEFKDQEGEKKPATSLRIIPIHPAAAWNTHVLFMR